MSNVRLRAAKRANRQHENVLQKSKIAYRLVQVSADFDPNKAKNFLGKFTRV